MYLEGCKNDISSRKLRDLTSDKAFSKFVGDSKFLDRERLCGLAESAIGVGLALDRRRQKKASDPSSDYNLAYDLSIASRRGLERSRAPLEYRSSVSVAINVPQPLRRDVLPYAELLDHIISELVANAAESFSAKGGEVHIKLKKSEDQYSIEIRDTGSGISPDILERIFDYGFSTKNIGTGNGLHYLKEAVEKIVGGSISVKSQVGIGTTFVLSIPMSIRENSHIASEVVRHPLAAEGN